ncbi:tRNA preQ1(34) S-adenosylmethionine ribosyltransferase-isomerase QueA [Aquabacterium sp. OR-4]|uniref:tRNA preQ1(34) S-adenosylmethionine ribosyltransferase-isomerase QueA n=1 Tax=Aquabacterium sp. OR-4 TaxID=2978127 RepID=UPI0021B2B1BC|nr:tRNA preQ1(34) S-adenosylmethionine ribosyltransferase-isomerase QueA [Aquabacterium sp. OR-4]MDT7833885.1 tRNA preQ1(34) S-adenosylmethionine ribosyltransferase-isomerase QueA [Aquabacterium sp. OR-4]
MRTYTVSDFDFDLPPELIAQHPAAERSASRLLDGTGPISAPPADRVFRELPALLSPGDLIVFNDTRVIKARLHGEKHTGGAVEALVERVQPRHEVWAHLRASKSPKPGSWVSFARGAFEAEVLGRCGPDDALFRLRFPADPLALLEAHGHVPLPPYITHGDGAEDVQRYQTVFASRPGAVAAPTASLHFDQGVLDALAARGVASTRVTLHVGAGTFQPVRSESLAEHKMHSEWYEVGAQAVADIAAARARGGRVIAAGTTALRALESAAQLSAQAGADSLQPGTGDTTLFITPGFQFRVVDRLITNFHLPRSTLLMLVSALAGHEQVRALYRHAIESRYRFFSYGDAMLLDRVR